VYLQDKDIATMQTIMEAGRKEFLEKGLKEASLRNIAKRCDITPGGFNFILKIKKLCLMRWCKRQPLKL